MPGRGLSLDVTKEKRKCKGGGGGHQKKKEAAQSSKRKKVLKKNKSSQKRPATQIGKRGSKTGTKGGSFFKEGGQRGPAGSQRTANQDLHRKETDAIRGGKREKAA